MKKSTKIIAVLVLVVLIVAAVFLYREFRPAAQAGAKSITVTVIHGDESQKVFDLHTDAENLRQACEEQNLIEGTESEYGLYVLTVDGETADESQQQWWCITKDGEDLMTGVDDTVISDGEKYEFTLTTGW